MSGPMLGVGFPWVGDLLYLPSCCLEIHNMAVSLGHRRLFMANKCTKDVIRQSATQHGNIPVSESVEYQSSRLLCWSLESSLSEGRPEGGAERRVVNRHCRFPK